MSNEKNIVNLSADPFLPTDWEILEHHKDGQFEFDPNKVALYLGKYQRPGSLMDSYELREELENRSAFNANLLDWLLEHPQLIPREWRGKQVFFWGTVYRDSRGNHVVRCLILSPNGWPCWRHGNIVGRFKEHQPAAIPVT
ncbi:MAG: hypothetical protein HQ530_00815 [Parcubacteria group bacterium]|nr:hypothetical protein [Parcubacteria group bacterium]